MRRLLPLLVLTLVCLHAQPARAPWTSNASSCVSCHVLVFAEIVVVVLMLIARVGGKRA